MKTKWYLGKLNKTEEKVYLEDFEWACDWYWAGGYVGNKNFHSHFDGCFLDVPDYRGHPLGAFYPIGVRLPDYQKEENVKRLSNGAAVWESLDFFLDDAQYNTNEWWRIKNLFKQFYALKDAAEVFQYGGHCSSDGRTDQEINKEMAEKINNHIKEVIIPLIRKALNKE